MYERILVPVDDEASMGAVFEHAIDIATQRDATVHVLHVIDDRAFLTLDESMREDVLSNLESEGEKTAADAAAHFEDAGVEAETAVVQGDPADEILGYAAETDVDLVVMGTRRGSYRESMLGSVSQKVVAGASVPVLTVNVASEA